MMKAQTPLTILGGVYVVIDPSMEEDILLQKLEIILQQKVAAVQIWDHFSPQNNSPAFIEKITTLCHQSNVPVLINNQWEWLLHSALDGVHFDERVDDLDTIRTQINRPIICGLTCNNDLSVVQDAEAQGMDYISFCSIFPSTTSNSCELVHFDTIKAARKMTTIPIFLAGGLTPDNLHQLKELDYDGVAVVSGIMRSSDPGEAVKLYLEGVGKTESPKDGKTGR